MTQRASTQAVVLRDTDVMRLGLEAAVIAVSMDAVTLELGEALQPGEHLALKLKNEIHRLEVSTRGLVRSVTPGEDGLFRVDVELLVRLLPGDVRTLRMGLLPKDPPPGTLWM